MNESLQECKNGILQAVSRMRPCVLVLSGQGLVVVKRGNEEKPWADGWRTRYVSPSLTDKAVAQEIALEAGVPLFYEWSGFVEGRER